MIINYTDLISLGLYHSEKASDGGCFEAEVAIVVPATSDVIGSTISHKFDSSILLDGTFVSDYFKNILADDKSLDEKVESDSLRKNFKDYAHIFQYVQKLQTIFDSKMNISIFQLKSSKSNKSM